jgi:hypothetical protein
MLNDNDAASAFRFLSCAVAASRRAFKFLRAALAVEP